MSLSDAEVHADLDAKLTDVEVALYTVAPTGAGGGTEVVGGAYARQTIPFGPAANRAKTQSADVVFPTATAIWGDIAAIGLFDKSDSRFIGWAPTETTKNIGVDDAYVLPSGSVVVRYS